MIWALMLRRAGRRSTVHRRQRGPYRAEALPAGEDVRATRRGELFDQGDSARR